MKMLRTLSLSAAMVSALALGAPAHAEMEKSSISLPATTITFLPVYVARDKGFWKDNGLDVTIHHIRGMGTTNAMLAGSVDFAVQSGPSLIRGNIRGRKMVGIALMANGIAFEVDVAPGQKGYDHSLPLNKRMEWLKGKKVSVDSPNTVVDVVLRYFAAKADLDPKRDLTMTYMQPTESIAALNSGAIDAAVLNFPWSETALRQGAVLLASGIDDLPELLPTIATTTTTRQGFCEEHTSICDKIAHGYVLAHKFIHEHPKESLDIALKEMPKANRADLEKSMKRTVLNTTPLVPRYDESVFKHAQQFMVFGGMLRKDEMRDSFDGFFTNKYVDKFAKPAS